MNDTKVTSVKCSFGLSNIKKEKNEAKNCLFRETHLSRSLHRVKITSLFFLLAMLLMGCVKNPTPSNVLWIYLEDVTGWFSCYGYDTVETPNIDALADSGVRFDRFYTPSGVCSTTRSAIITGMMQTSIGAHNHRSSRPVFRGLDMSDNYDKNILPDDVTPLPIIFREAGYWTFNEGANKDDYNFDWSPEAFYDKVNKILPKKESFGPNRFISGEMLANKPKGKPFFGQIHLAGGKLGRDAPKVVDRAKIPLPPYYPDIPELRERLANHYDCLLKTDEQVGQIIAALKKMGEYENTVIFLFSDHGMKLHRFKQWLYEGGIRNPLIVSGPGVKKKAVREDLVSGIDVSATSLATAGISLPETMEGKNFFAKDFKRDYVVAARDRCDYTIDKVRAIVTPRFKYLRNYLTDRTYMAPNYMDKWKVTKRMREMIAKGEMNETQLLFFGDKRLPEEFYDLEKDPHEINNLANDPAFAKELEAHRQMLAEWIEETGDQGQQPESDIGLLRVLRYWGDACVNPEFDRVRHLLDKKK